MPYREPYTPVTAEERAVMVDLYVKEDLYIDQIAVKMNRSPSTVWRHLTAAGVKMRPPGLPHTRKREAGLARRLASLGPTDLDGGDRPGEDKPSNAEDTGGEPAEPE